MKKKTIILAASLILALGMLCSCGSSSDESATTESTTEKATVTAGDAAELEASKKAAKPGTEDGALQAAKEKAKADIKGFDGNWENLSVDVDDPITTIDFDWKGTHYQYQFDQTSGKIIK